MIVEWVEDDAPHSVMVERPYAMAVARVLADDLGLSVKLNGERVDGPASPADRGLYDSWLAGRPDHGREG